MEACSSSTGVECCNCHDTKVKEHEIYRCQCPSATTEEIFCDDCIISHTKSKHEVKDHLGYIVPLCCEHSIIMTLYCLDDKQLICFKCRDQHPDDHKLVKVADEAINFKKSSFYYWNLLEEKEKYLKSRKTKLQLIVSAISDQDEKLQVVINEFIVALEKIIREKVKAVQNTKSKMDEMKQMESEIETCIADTIEFQKKIRELLPASEGSLIKQFVNIEAELLSLVAQQDRLINSVTSIDSNFKFDKLSFEEILERTAEEFMSHIECATVTHVEKNDMTDETNCVIENITALVEKQKNCLLPNSDISHLGFFVTKQPNSNNINLERASFFVEEKENDEATNSTVRLKTESKTIFLETETNVMNAHCCEEDYVVFITENGRYLVYDYIKKKIVKDGEIGLTNYIGPVKVDEDTNTVDWVYWDEGEKTIRVSGNDNIRIPSDHKPQFFCYSRERGVFSLINNTLDILVVEAGKAANYLTIVPQTQHTLAHIDFCSYDNNYLEVFDLIGKERALLTIEEIENDDDDDDAIEKKETDGKEYNKTINHFTLTGVGYWRGENCIIRLSDNYFFCTKPNFGTAEQPRFKHFMLLKY